MVFIFHYAVDLGDHVAAPFDFHPVANVDAKALDFVHIVQGGPADGGPADRNRLQGRNRSEFSRASNLHQDVFDLRDS